MVQSRDNHIQRTANIINRVARTITPHTHRSMAVKEGMIKGFTPRRIVTGHDSDGMSWAALAGARGYENLDAYCREVI